MEWELPPLPYAKSALEPHMGCETLEFHYEKHHRGYLNKLQKAIGNKPEGQRSLEEIIRSAEGSVFDNAAQVWNHTFFWNSMESKGGGEPPKGDVAEGPSRAPSARSRVSGNRSWRRARGASARATCGSSWTAEP